MHYSKRFAIIALVLAGFSACVPSRQFHELKEKNAVTVAERDTLKSMNETLTVQNTEMEAELEELKRRLDRFANDNSSLKDSANYYKRQYLIFEKMYADLSDQHTRVSQKQDAETVKLLAELQVTKEDLQQREKTLRDLEKEMQQKQLELDERGYIMAALDSSLNQKRLEMEKQSQRIAELERVLHSKDSAAQALRNKIADALLGFEGKGLTVTQRGGKVYVTMDNKLLFKSGEWSVDPKGQEALTKMAKVLEQNADINILVEGHTDDVPMKGTGEIQDNWDLSVKRATAIVKIIEKNSKINMKRITAAGRGQYMPIENAKTPEARAKNRRTEIILSPNLDELLKILGTE